MRVEEKTETFAEKMKRLYGDDIFHVIGAMGGRAGRGSKGFAVMERQRLMEISRKGGLNTQSKRRGNE